MEHLTISKFTRSDLRAVTQRVRNSKKRFIKFDFFQTKKKWKSSNTKNSGTDYDTKEVQRMDSRQARGNCSTKVETNTKDFLSTDWNMDLESSSFLQTANMMNPGVNLFHQQVL